VARFIPSIELFGSARTLMATKATITQFQYNIVVTALLPTRGQQSWSVADDRDQSISEDAVSCHHSKHLGISYLGIILDRIF